MTTWKKATLVGLAFATTAGVYGTARFHLQRYTPQCDHLPGLCVYGSSDPESAGVRIERRRDGAVIRTLEICYSDCTSLSAVYKDENSRVPESISLGRNETYSCLAGKPVQLVVSPRNTLVPRGCYGGSVFPSSLDNLKSKAADLYYARDPERYLAPLMGLHEIFSRPRPLELRCAEGASVEAPAICSDSGARRVEAEDLACGMERRLSEIGQLESGFRRCRIQQARRSIVQALGENSPQVLTEGRLREEVFRGNLTLRDTQNREEQQAEGGFSRAWDLLFGAAFIAAIALAIKKALKKARPSGSRA